MMSATRASTGSRACAGCTCTSSAAVSSPGRQASAPSAHAHAHAPLNKQNYVLKSVHVFCVVMLIYVFDVHKSEGKLGGDEEEIVRDNAGEIARQLI